MSQTLQALFERYECPELSLNTLVRKGLWFSTFYLFMLSTDHLFCLPALWTLFVCYQLKHIVFVTGVTDEAQITFYGKVRQKNS